VTAVYCASAFVVVQAADYVFAALRFPSWTLSFVVVLALLGLPLAIALAWALEVTPEGIRRTSAVESDAAGGEATTDTVVPLQRPDAPANSIAVLPFANLSPDPDNEFFSDGLTEEIIADLSQIRALRVISRTSVMAFKGTARDLRSIARALGVRHILEGSVRKAGDSLRVTAQLIDAESDSHLWAEKYNGTMGDVFDLQERVSRAIVDALQLQLAPDEERRLVHRPFDDARAYETFLRARHEIYSFTPDGFERALRLAHQGLERVGEHPLFHVIAGTVYWQYMHAGLCPATEYGAWLDRAETCARKALTLDPESSPAHLLLAMVHNNRGAPQAMAQAAREAVRLDPASADALLWLAWARACAGDGDGARSLFERVHLLAPLDSMPYQAGALAAILDGRSDDALKLQEKARELATSHHINTFSDALIDAYTGKTNEAARVVGALAGKPNELPVWRALYAFLAAAWRGDREAALGALTADLAGAARWDDQQSWYIADGLAHVGAHEEAIEWILHTIDYGVAAPEFWTRHDPLVGRLRDDEAFSRVADHARAASTALLVTLGRGADVNATTTRNVNPAHPDVPS
jgi:TolB-like protein